MASIEGGVDTLAFAAYLIVLAFLPTFAAVLAVSHQINTLVLATTPPGAALRPANPWELLASPPPGSPLP